MNINNRGMRVRPIMFLVGILFLAVYTVKCQATPSCLKSGTDTVLLLECSNVVDLSIDSIVMETVTVSGKSLTALTIVDSPQFEFKKEEFENTLLSELRELSIKRCGLTTFNSEPIRGLINLRVLNLGLNNLTTISADTFEGLAGVESLRLHGNRIVTIDASALKPLKNLTSLDLNDNELSTITPGLFQGTSLFELDIGDNLLATVNEGDFSGADTLIHLELGDNIIKTIHSLAFRNLRALNYLDLSDNYLEGLDSRLFETNPIIALDLKGNNLENLANFPLNITSLRGLRLVKANIRNIPIDYFSNLPKLVVLALGVNNITTIQPGLFSGNRNILRLHLENNALTSLNIKSFEQLYTIINRKLSDLDEEVIFGFTNADSFSLKSEVQLANNNWDCTTQEMIELKAWIEQNGLTFEKLFECTH